jgi:tRNA 2-selenouridine synthase
MCRCEGGKMKFWNFQHLEIFELFPTFANQKSCLSFIMPVENYIDQFLEKSILTPIIDVRSPAEFGKGHIPGAINIPLFSDEERAIIGTLYVQKGKDDAVLKGLELVGPKMKDFVLEAKRAARDHQLLVHCWRGGMRSKSMAWLFEQIGLKTTTLTGGYKAYRNFVLDKINCQPELIVIGGMTGSGKSEILRELKSISEQILDLEALANHKGSAFGALGQPVQPTQEQFENNLFDEIRHLDLQKRIWIEDESFAIGRNQLPKRLFETMQQSPLVFILTGKQSRIKRLVNEYGGFSKDLLAESIKKIEKRLGYDQAKAALEALKVDNFEAVADITLRYYDKAYQWQIQNRKPESVTEVALNSDDAAAIAKEICGIFTNI